MIERVVTVHPSAEQLAREEQLAWHLAALAADAVALDGEVVEMIVNRIIDDTAVAVAALGRHPVEVARAQAAAHPGARGATVIGAPRDVRVSPEWAAWANGVAVRELDFHDTYLGAEFAHPGDNIPPLLAVGQHAGSDGASLARAIATGYEIQIDLAKSICLHEHRIDHIAHLGVSIAGGLGTILDQPVEIIFQAIGQALHTTTTTRQSRKGTISSWKAYAPAFAGKVAVEAMDRAMRAEQSPTPIYEGEDGVIAWMLDGPAARYVVGLPSPGEAKRAILDSYTKAHSAEYQAQALIDLAFRMRTRVADLRRVARITIATSNHTHVVIGSGSHDPQKLDPAASRETLDHSLAYIFAVALEDGTFHHEASYAPERARRPETVALWHTIETVEDPGWTARYHDPDPSKKAFGGRVVIELDDGSSVTDELAVADAHPNGARPFRRAEYVEKFHTLCEGVVEPGEQARFLDAATRLVELGAGELGELGIVAAHPNFPPVDVSRGVW